MTTSRYCAMCDISYNDAPDSCPLCKTKRLLKMAEDEAVYYGEQLLIEQDRADKLETELESIKELLIEVREQYYYISCEKGGEYYKVRKKIDDLLDLNEDKDEFRY